MINWTLARHTARTAVGTNWLEVGRPLEELNKFYAETVADSKALIAEFTGWPLSQQAESVAVVDREGWVDANIGQFEQLFSALDLDPFAGITGPFAGMASAAGSAMLSVQLGLLLAFLSRRVLGQYDVALFGNPETRKVLFVEPNIQRVVEKLNVGGASFRVFLSLHETAHVAEFGAHPWLSEHLQGLMREFLATLRDQVAQTLAGANKRSTAAALFGQITPEQRVLFEQLQASMSVVEGFGDYVMHRLAPRRLADWVELDHKFSARRKKRSPLEQVIYRLTGLDVKLAQYELGEKFVQQVLADDNTERLSLLWQGPQSLPTMEELRQPPLWIERVASRPPSPAP